MVSSRPKSEFNSGSEGAVRAATEDEGLRGFRFQEPYRGTSRELVHLALKEFVESHTRKDLRELRGVGGISPDYDHKALRD